jgi:hypothetical protein
VTRHWHKLLIALIALIAVAVLLLGGNAYRRHQFTSADRGFRTVTGRELPANVTAMSHSSAITDNFFHNSHFWLLQGPHAALRELAPVPDFERSDDDAKQWLHEASDALTLADSEILEGYEGGERIVEGRHRWLLILPPGDRAVFIY